MSDIQVTEGRTAPIDEQLTLDVVAPNMSGYTLSLLLTGRDGVAVTTTGNAAWLDATLAKARYNPDAADLVAAKSPYRKRWKVVDLQGKISFFPEGHGDELMVYKP